MLSSNLTVSGQRCLRDDSAIEGPSPANVCGIMRGMTSARALGFAVSTLLLVVPFTWAQTQAPFEIKWSAPADCPDGRHIRDEVLRLAGQQAEPAPHLKAEVTLRPDEHKGWALDLQTELDGIRGERHLAGVSCHSLSEAAALTLALLLNPQARIEPAPESPPPRAQEPASVPKMSKTERPWPKPVWNLGALAGVEVGVLRDPSSWFGLSLGMALDRFSLRLLPGFSPPQNLSSQSRTGSGGRLWMLSGSALGCYAVVDRWAWLTPCLGANLVRLHGRGWGVLRVREATVFWTSAELALLASLPLTRVLRLELWGFGLVTLSKSSVYLDEAGLISQPSSFGYGALAGISVALP